MVCRFPPGAFDYIVKARQSARTKTKELKTDRTQREVMPQYLVAVYHRDDYDPSVETEAMIEKIHALNRELIAAGAICQGLHPNGG
jgi:hypothetical protein